MATKTHIAAGEYRIESDNLSHGIETSEHVGTAINLARALESSGDTLATITVGRDLGKAKVTLFGRWGDAGGPSTVPGEVHDQLIEWGYEHAGGEDYGPSDEVRSHVYVKD